MRALWKRIIMVVLTAGGLVTLSLDPPMRVGG